MLARTRKAFTLLELMIAFVIMTILSAVAIPSLLSVATNDRHAADNASAIALADAVYYQTLASDTSGAGNIPVPYASIAHGALTANPELTAPVTVGGCTLPCSALSATFYFSGDYSIAIQVTDGTDGSPAPVLP